MINGRGCDVHILCKTKFKNHQHYNLFACVNAAKYLASLSFIGKMVMPVFSL